MVLLLLLLAVLLLLLMIPKFKKVHHEKSEFQIFFLQIYLHVKFKNELLRKKSPNLWLKSKLKNFKLVYYYFGLIHFSVKLKYHIIYVIKIKITIVVGDQVVGMFGLDDP